MGEFGQGLGHEVALDDGERIGVEMSVDVRCSVVPTAGTDERGQRARVEIGPGAHAHQRPLLDLAHHDRRLAHR